MRARTAGMGLVLAGLLAWSVTASAQAPAADDAAQQPSASITERLQGAWKNLDYLHTAGGFCMYGIDVLLILGVAVILERLIRLRRSVVLPVGLWKEVSPALESGNLQTVRDLCQKKKRSTLSKVLLHIADHRTDTDEELETTTNEIASRDVDVHRMMCYPLMAVCGLAPLIGLLGTVVGIRECFRDIALAGEMGKPAMLAGGIEKALITTIYGLIVAIPTLFAYNLFKFRINLLAMELEEVISSIMARVLKTGHKKS